MTKPKIYLRDRVYVPEDCLDVVDVTDEYTYRTYDNGICAQCEFREYRHCQECDDCQHGGLTASYCLVNHKTIKGVEYIGFPFGDQNRIEKRANIKLSKFKIIDQTTKTKFNTPVEFTGELRDYQEEPVEIVADQMLGLLQSKPRTGKCVDGDSIVDTSLGQFSMRRLWEIIGTEQEETVMTKGLTTVTQSGVESITMMHRKRAKLLNVGTHLGHLLTGTYEHPVQVVTPDLKIQWRRLDELTVGDWIVSKLGFAQDRKAVRLTAIEPSTQGSAKHIRQPDVVTEELAYLTGCWIANGALVHATSGNNYGTLSFSSNNPKVQSKYLEYMKSIFDLDSEFTPGRTVESVKYHSAEVVRFLKTNGLSFTSSRGKTIPDYILASGRDMHLAFLKGYASCDSTYSDSGLYLCTASRLLFKQLKVLLQSLGMMPRCNIKSKCATNGSRIYRDYGNLTLKCNQFELFESLITLDKPRTPSRRTAARNAYCDSDIVPYLTSHVNELPSEDFNGVYSGRKPSKNKEGHMARSTLARLDRSFLSADLKAYAEFADGHVFQQVVALYEGDNDWVYDLTVKGSHSFIANGFVVHNTVMSIAAAIRAGYRTCFLADQKDFLDGFDETIESMTNLPQLEEELGRKLYGFPKTINDYEKFEILLVTYQSLIGKSKACADRLKAINKNYGAICVDEVHRANATCFARTLGSVKATMRIALTATPKRKDKREYLVRNLIGPVIATTNAEALVPTIVVQKTPKTVKTRAQYKGRNGFTRLCQFLSRHKDRHEYILDWVKRDLAKGRSIVIPLMFKDDIFKMVRDINAMMRKPVAAAFVGGAKSKNERKEIVKAARSGEIRVVVGIRRLLQLGLNVPKWDTLYYVSPMNNAPNWEQESCRICTPDDNKKTPIIRMFFDDNVSSSISFFRATYKHSQALGYKTSAKSRRKLERWLGIYDQKDSMRDVPDFFEVDYDKIEKRKNVSDGIGRSL